MGLFYGNKGVATANTNLVFDRVYSSFWSMKVNMTHDNIYYGRNALIEYGNQASPTLVVEDIYLLVHNRTNASNLENVYLYKEAVSSDNVSQRLIYGGEPAHPSETIATTVDASIKLGQIVKIYRDDKNGAGYEYWACSGGKSEDGVAYATFTRLCAHTDPEYFKNRAIDCWHHDPDKTNWKMRVVDYDSTVWQRVDFSVDRSGFVNIATLNATLPTFYTGVEAPTLAPEDPHFSHDSGGVYYQLRMQPQWGFRLAKAADGANSDFNTEWTEYTYNNNNDESKIVRSVPAAINFNSKALNIKNEDGSITRHDNTKNEIKLKPTGLSHKRYLPHYDANNKENKNNVPAEAIDTQELTINLPIIGNVISDVYDIVYGENRDSGNGSLVGYLKVFEDLPNNSIPVKSEDGVLIGAALNSNHWIKATASNTDKKITINHDVPEEYEEGNVIYGPSELAPAHGGTITIPTFSVDSNGHVKKNIANQTITLPAISLENEDSGNLVTGLILSENTGAFVASNANVGTLALTEYVNDTNDLVLATDTINEAFKKLVDKLATETANRENDTGSAATALANAKTELTEAYQAADASLKTDLEGQINAAKTSLTTDYDTKIGNETAARTTAITSLDTRLTTEINDRKAAISTEQTARDNAITTAINKEVENRDAAISSAIGVEVTNRGTAITSAIAGEVTARNEAITNAINTEITNRDAAIKAGIEALDVTDTAVEGQYISQVVETDGKISVTRANLPDYSNKYDENTKLVYNDTEMTIGDLFAKVADLEARLAVLENPTV